MLQKWEYRECGIEGVGFCNGVEKVEKCPLNMGEPLNGFSVMRKCPDHGPLLQLHMGKKDMKLNIRKMGVAESHHSLLHVL